KAHRAHVGVGVGPEVVGAAAEQFRLGGQLAVHLEPDHRLPGAVAAHVVASPNLGRALKANPASNERAARSSTASPSAGASTCTPIGRPAASRPAGTETAQAPVRLVGIVHTSDRYMASGSDILAPSSKAVVGDVGASSTSKRS